MSIFGKKFDSSITRFGNKIKHANVHKFGNKIIHGIHSGLNVADKVLSTVGKASDYVGKVGKALSNAGVPGAGLITLGAKSVSGLSKTADKGVKGLEKATSKVEYLGDTIGKARKSILDSKYNADVIGAQAQNVMNANPLKKNM